MATGRTRTKSKTPVPAPVIEEDEFEDDETEDDETDAVEAEEESGDEEETPLDKALRRKVRRNERAYTTWLNDVAGVEIEVSDVHNALSLYRMWKASEEYSEYREQLAYERDHKDEAVAAAKLERLLARKDELEAQLAASKEAREAPAAKAAPKASGKKRGRPAKVAAPVVAVPDIEDDEEGDDDEEF